MSGLVTLDMGGIIKAGAGLLDDLFTSDEEKLSMQLQEKKLDVSLVQGQLEINKAEAGHRSLFVAGWRPFIGWVGGFALGYKFLFFPFLSWGWCLARANGWIPVESELPPAINADELYPIIMGMLGLGTMRTVEGIRGVKSGAIATSQPAGQGKSWWPWSKK